MALLLGTVGLINAAPAFAANANSGDGTMAVSPTSVVAGSTGNQFTFVFTAPAAGKFSNGSQVTVRVPVGWTAPSTTAGTPGYTTVTSTASCPASISSVSGTGPWTITVSQTCDAGAQFTLIYGTGNNPTHVTAPTAPQSSTFTTASRSGPSGSAVDLAVSPQVTVTPAAASKLVFVQGPSSVAAGSAISPAITVQLQDPSGNAVSTSGVAVTLAVSAGVIDAGASATTNSAGRATFGVVINAAAVGLTMTASASGLTSTPESAAFNVTVAVSNGAVVTGAVNDGGGAGVSTVSYYYCAGYTGACTSSNWTLIGASSTAAGGYPVTWNGQPGNGPYRLVVVGTDNVTNVSQPSLSIPVTVTN